MNIEDKLSIIADEIRDETIAELRNKLLPKIVGIEREINEIKDLLRVNSKIEIFSNSEDEGKVATLRKAVSMF
jgi:hypothetical protein